MKIAILCHFTNKNIQDKIKPLFHSREFAPWIENYITEFKKYPQHQFYLISPHQWLTKDFSFSDGNIHYYFYKWGMPLIGRRWPSYFDIDYLTHYKRNKQKTNKIIEDIKPDVINLVGAENPYYSSSIIQFKGKYPILITIQGFVSRARVLSQLSNYQKYRLELEHNIISSFKHFNIRTDNMWEQIRLINPKANAHRYSFPIDLRKYDLPEKSKIYDFVFFARVSKDKGIYDYLDAIHEVKKSLPTVKAMVIGPCNDKTRDVIRKYIKVRELEENISFVGFVPSQQELFSKVKSAKISVLPTYNDLISGTIIESMFLKLPVVTYRTGSIPEVNRDRENLIICGQGDQKELQVAMLKLLKDKEKQAKLAKNGYEWVSQRFNNEESMKGYFSALHDIINNFTTIEE
ncbi:glycosyltransferase [bacterium]|nr:glycosyltransferase [bacterium]